MSTHGDGLLHHERTMNEDNSMNWFGMKSADSSSNQDIALKSKVGDSMSATTLEQSRVMSSLKMKDTYTKPSSTVLSLEQKFQCCQLHDSGVSIKALCLQYGQSKFTITNIVQNKHKIMAEWFRFSNPFITKKQRLLKSNAYAEINAAILDWYWAFKASGKTPTGVGIQTKAKEVAQQLGYHTFKASNGEFGQTWL